MLFRDIRRERGEQRGGGFRRVGPEVDKAAEGEVGDDVGGGEDLHGGRTSVVAGV
ncbi:hypothetical protein LguiA_004289 [Lonicera macranthoides]